MLKTFDFEKMPIVEIVNEILVDSSKRGASDIHFDPQENFMKVRIRIDGELHDYCEVPNAVKKNLTTRVKIIAGMNITESRLPQDGAIKATLQDIDLDLRVSVLPVSNGEKIVIRILDYTKSLSGLEQLDFSEDNFKKVLYMIGVPNGIILVTGATGSGKSTTVYSILQRLNRVDTNLITVEDPIEMDIEGINQVQVNAEIGLTFASALRSILRQDPNIIMIGEIRDTETAKIAVRASITGHLVLSTIHTNNSLNTIERLLDMDVERYLLSSALTGIISQKLARRLCPKCKALRKTNEYEKKLFKTVLNKDIDEVYSAVGCEECGNGYSGRIAIHEVLVINQQIRDALSSGMKKEDLRTLVYSSDIHSLLQDSLEKVIAGHSTVEEMLKLIELENDDKLAGELDLKKALEFSEIANEAEHNEVATNQVAEVTGDALATTFETETPESAAPIAPAQVDPTPVAEPVAAPVQTPEVTSTPVAPATPVVNEVVTPQAPVMPAETNVTLEQPVIAPVEVPTVNPTVVPTITPAENPNAGIPEIVS
ncbi:MAG: Flp pilus assembly complex ATPase component TadA [Bacilli bacterium]|nr:Flp pilus assembly complex ATPase component TadA [Bacilli bacterium]